MAKKDFAVRVKTAKVEHGGTDSDVWVSLRAENGKYSDLWLYLTDTDYDDLEQGQIDTYVFRIDDFTDGTQLDGFVIAMQPHGSDPSWYLEYIAFGEWVNGEITRLAGQVYSPYKILSGNTAPAGLTYTTPIECHHIRTVIATPPGAPFEDKAGPLTEEQLRRLG